MAEWFKAPVLKTGEANNLREFESHLFRHTGKNVIIFPIVNAFSIVAP